jgi:predicted nucleotidyltransferase
MGNYKETQGLAGVLFTPVQRRVLGLLFGQPNRSFLGKELITLAAAGTGATHRLLQRLVGSGLVSVRPSGRQKHYQANPDSPIFHELVSLVRKTAGLQQPVLEALQPWADRIHTAFIYGSAASGEDRADSDIDVLVVSDELDYPTMLGALEPAERELGRKVSPRLMRTSEWNTARNEPGSFIARIAERPQVYLIGGGDAD